MAGAGPSSPPEDADRRAGAPRGVGGVLRVAALSLLPLALLLAATEALLWSLGLGELQQALPFGRGFAPDAAYLVRDGDGWRTVIHETPDRDVVIPPKGDLRRVLLVGGSNTMIMPEALLTLRLSALDDDPDSPGWEVFNLGRAGYGSERAAILLRQALVTEPEVVVVYSGHNEFVEAGFEQELREARGGDARTALTGLLSRLRLFRVAEGALRGAVRPEAMRRLDPAARDIPWEQTERHLTSYRTNLDDMVTRSLAAGAEVVLCTLLSNPLSPPFVTPLAGDVPPDVAARFESLRQQGQAAIPRPFREALRPPVRLRLASWEGGDGVVSPDGLPVLRPLSGALAPRSADIGPPETQPGTHWPPVSGWHAEVMDLLPAMARLMERRPLPIQRESLQRAEGLLRDALDLAPDHGGALFDLGLVTWLLGGRDDEARELFLRAADRDHAPHAATRLSNGLVREVAALHPEAVLLDVERLYQRRSPDGLPGYELLMDSNHLQPGVRRVLMDDLARTILGLPLVDAEPPR